LGRAPYPLPNFLGCSLDVGPWTPSRFPFAGAIRCHQKSKEHIQLGWVVHWVLSTPPGPPHGWVVRPCRASASTSLAPLYSPCASSAFDSPPDQEPLTGHQGTSTVATFSELSTANKPNPASHQPAGRTSPAELCSCTMLSSSNRIVIYVKQIG
jgi:hypothetical protein